MSTKYLRRVGSYSLVVLSILAIVVSSLFVIPLQASAASDADTIMRKTLVNAITACYPTLKDGSDGQITGENFVSNSSRDDPMEILWTKESKNDKIYLPNQIGNSINDAMISCQEVFNGYHNRKQDVNGLFSIYGKSNPTLGDLGYTRDERATGYKGCMTLSYKEAGPGGVDVSVTSNTYCLPVNDDGTISVGVIPSVTQKPDGFTGLSLGYDWNGCGMFQSGICELWVTVYRGSFAPFSVKVYDRNGGETFSNIVSKVNEGLNAYYNGAGSDYTAAKVSEDLTPDDLFVYYTRSNVKDMIKYFTGNETAPKFTNDDRNFLLDTYYQRFKDAGYISEDNGKCDQIKGNVSTSEEYPYLHYDTAKGWCPVRATSSDLGYMQYNIVAPSRTELIPATGLEILQSMTDDNHGYKDVAEYCDKVVFHQRVEEISAAWTAAKKEVDPADTVKLKELEDYYMGLATQIGDLRREGKYTETDSEGNTVCAALPTVDGGMDQTKPDTSIDNTPDTNPDDNQEPDNGTPSCWREGSSLGWILCPVLQITGSAVGGIYNWVVENWLEVGADEIEAKDNNGAYVGWKVFQEFANIIFVILLTIVILSQFTGKGISNYGIKKILPTLIVVAVLVNISFYLCQIAVDVTNILGNELNNLFSKTLANRIGAAETYGVDNFAEGLLSSALQIGTIGVAGVTIVMSSGIQLGALLVPALLVFVSCLIGVIFFFLVLAIRKAGIVVLIVISPVAIVCYALPNTKKFFDRWLKLFTSLLMVYPICGLLMGGGKFFSKILLGSGNIGFFMALTAMLLQVVPFFFIPTLVRGSLAMAGNIGAKLSAIGSRLSGKANGAIGKSRWAQDRQQMFNRNANMRRDKRLAAKGRKTLDTLNQLRANPDDPNDLTGLNKKQQRRYRRAEYEYNRARSRSDRAMIEDMQNAVSAGRGVLEPGSARYENVMDKLTSAARDEEVEELRSSLLNGHMSYSDGSNTYDVDVNTIGSIGANGALDTSRPGANNSMGAALLHYMRRYDTNPSDRSAIANARAIAAHLLEAGGDKGQTAVTNALRGYTTATGGNTKTQAFSDLTSYIARNGKWMGKIKPTDKGAFSLINDGASSTVSTLRPSSEYNTTGGYAADMVPDLSDGMFDAVDRVIADSTQSNPMDRQSAQNIMSINSTLEQAFSDPRIAGRIKPDVTKRANNIHEAAYKIERDAWLQSSDNVQKLKGVDGSGTTVNAAGMDSQGYLVDAGGNRLRNRNGGSLTARSAYRSQIKNYRALNPNTSQADVNIPH